MGFSIPTTIPFMPLSIKSMSGLTQMFYSNLLTENGLSAISPSLPAPARHVADLPVSIKFSEFRRRNHRDTIDTTDGARPQPEAGSLDMIQSTGNIHVSDQQTEYPMEFQWDLPGITDTTGWHQAAAMPPHFL